MKLEDLSYYIAIIVQIITLVILTVKYKDFKTRYAFYFLCFIYVTVLVEIIGLVYLKILEEYSASIYNVYLFFEFNLVALIYLQLIKERFTIQAIYYLCIAFNILYFISFLDTSLQLYTLSIESIIVSLFFIAYLRELLNSDKILNYKKHLPFWITTGFMIFYLSSIPFQLIRDDLDTRDMFFVQMFIIYIMHSCFIYGLLWSKAETRY